MIYLYHLTKDSVILLFCEDSIFTKLHICEVSRKIKPSRKFSKFTVNVQKFHTLFFFSLQLKYWFSGLEFINRTKLALKFREKSRGEVTSPFCNKNPKDTLIYKFMHVDWQMITDIMSKAY